jgi:uncharacterized alpha-E superfamily protein
MLCRTASDLYWLTRYVERAENTARLIDLTQRIALLPERLDPGKSEATAWQRALDALGLLDDYAAGHGAIDADRVMVYLTLDPLNANSIRHCLFRARELGRAQRGAITAEMYQELNAAWLELDGLDTDSAVGDGASPFLDWVKSRSAAFRGVTIGTMSRDEGYHFMTLGTFVERADNTVRLLDTKYAQISDTEAHEERSFVQYYQWSAMLQAMSAFETYRKRYRDAVTPLHVAEMLIFHGDMPRSLAVCCRTLHRLLVSLADASGSEVVRQAGALSASLRYGRMQDVLEQGMTSFLDQFMQRLQGLTEEITHQFMISSDVGMSGADADAQRSGAMIS